VTVDEQATDRLGKDYACPQCGPARRGGARQVAAQAWLLSEDSHLLDGHPATIAYIADVDPAHRLADIKLKRAILAMYKYQAGRYLPPGVHDGRDDDERECDEAMMYALEDVLRQLGTEFSGHPAYQESWKP
jgi:hypothetical protein